LKTTIITIGKYRGNPKNRVKRTNITMIRIRFVGRPWIFFTPNNDSFRVSTVFGMKWEKRGQMKPNLADRRAYAARALPSGPLARTVPRRRTPSVDRRRPRVPSRPRRPRRRPRPRTGPPRTATRAVVYRRLPPVVASRTPVVASRTPVRCAPSGRRLADDCGDAVVPARRKPPAGRRSRSCPTRSDAFNRRRRRRVCFFIPVVLRVCGSPVPD